MSILHRSKKPHTCAEICRELGKFKTLRAITVFELKPILSEMVTEEKLYAQEFAVVNGQSINSTTKYGVEPTKSSSKQHRSLNNFDWDQLLGKTRH